MAGLVKFVDFSLNIKVPVPCMLKQFTNLRDICAKFATSFVRLKTLYALTCPDIIDRSEVLSQQIS